MRAYYKMALDLSLARVFSTSRISSILEYEKGGCVIKGNSRIIRRTRKRYRFNSKRLR